MEDVTPDPDIAAIVAKKYRVRTADGKECRAEVCCIFEDSESETFQTYAVLITIPEEGVQDDDFESEASFVRFDRYADRTEDMFQIILDPEEFAHARRLGLQAIEEQPDEEENVA